MDRDITSNVDRPQAVSTEGRNVIVVVGIDRYGAWPTLDNAVNDATGTLRLFQRLGFEPLVAPLLNEAATADSLRRLVTDDLAVLRSDDSLVVFFAGHGHTQTRALQSGPVQTGFLIPVDGDGPDGRTASWLRLDSWLSDVARLPARHILVILDACHSGVALGSMIKWRGAPSTPRDGALDELRRRQSRRVITSALGDQRAMDGGPVERHSLFTGCLIEGLTGGLVRNGRREATASEIGVYVQQRVASYTESRQTPDFGTLELDDRGELVVPIAIDMPPSPPMIMPLIDANPMRHSREAISDGRVRQMSAAAHRHSTTNEIHGDAQARRAEASPAILFVLKLCFLPMWIVAPKSTSALLSPFAAWLGTRKRWIGAMSFLLAFTLFTSATTRSATSGIVWLCVFLPIAIAMVVGRVIPAAPGFIRRFSTTLLKHKLWTVGTIAGAVFGIALGMSMRSELDRTCSDRLAAAVALQQTGRDGAGAAFAKAATACEAVGRDEDVRRATEVAQQDPSRQSPSMPPIPPEPTPLAAKSGDVPVLEAKLVADKGYITAWTPDHVAERAMLLTAMSAVLAHGSVDTGVETAVREAGLTEAVAILNGILARIGTLPADFTSRVEAYLVANKTAPRRGLWNPREKGKPSVDATALAMWMHPNEPNFVRERMLALAKGPFRYTEEGPVARRWLAHVGDVAVRLNALGAFTRADCVALGLEYHETVAQGGTRASCDAPANGNASSDTPPALPPEPAPRVAAKAAEVPGLEATLAADKAYSALWNGARPDLNTFLTAVSELLAEGRVSTRVTQLLEHKKLWNAAMHLYLILSRVGHYPDDFTAKLETHLDGVKQEPHLGLWSPFTKKTDVIHDITALAVWTRRRDPAYLRERLAAKTSGGPFSWAEHERPPERPWLVTESAALERLALLTKLTPEEDRRLAELKAEESKSETRQTPRRPR